jgi:hypothetical protein
MGDMVNPLDRRLLSIVLLAAGMVAWMITLAVIVDALQDDGDPPEPVVERVTLAAATATAPPSPTPVPTQLPSPTPVPPSPTPLPATPAASATPVVEVDDSTTEEKPAETDSCLPPDGWERYVVQPDDTLFAFVLGAEGTVSVDDLVAANCLTGRYLQIGQVLYLPPGAAENAPPSVPAAVAAAAPTGPRTPNCPCMITITSGWRREQIADAINAAQTAFTGADFLAVTGPDASAPFDFVMERPPGTSMEGFLLPGAYTLQNETTAEDFRNMLLEAFAANISPQMRADAAAQGVSFYQALIVASIVQREVRGPETQKLVASVYYNRLRDGNRLASTVPIQYALGAAGNWWPRVSGSALETETPYNTYTRPGLPPTPVDNPGISAIVAAVYPAQTDYYYHTASCDGSGEAFAVTYEEHLANVNCD